MSTKSSKALRVLVAGCGRMGGSHAKVYHAHPEFSVAGLVSRNESKDALNRELGGGIPVFSDYRKALETTKPDVVSINTYPDTHEDYAVRAFESGAHVFLEKPIASTVAGGRRVIEAAQRARKKMVVGYVLRHHPTWTKFVEIAQGLGKPLVMRMNLNQQSRAETWTVAKNLMLTSSPIVDCGVHYVDVMCQMTGSLPIRVSAIGARLSDEIAKDMYNYGQLQVVFKDGSVGWYEAGWGPMVSETAYFVKDVFGPKGSVSITAQTHSDARSDRFDAHARTDCLKVHHAQLDAKGEFVKKDELLDMSDEPDHAEMCLREQQYLLKAIREDIDLTQHMTDALTSLRIVLAADESVRSGKTVEL